MSEEKLIQSIRDIYRALEDDLSKKLYIDRLNWLITEDYRYVEQIVAKSHPDFPVWNREKEENFIELLPLNKTLIFWGAGSFAKRVVAYVRQADIPVMFCDTNEDIVRDGFCGYKVISPRELFEWKSEKNIVICTTKYYEEVRAELLKNGIKETEIVDVRAFFKCGTGDEYFYEDFLKYEDEEIFIDAGCYDLATTMEFFKVCKGLKKVYAFEPDKDNYEKCKKRIGQEKNSAIQIELFPYGTWNGRAQLQFSATSDGSSYIGEGDIVIETAAIDEIVDKEEKITFIKMDVEGAELESLQGAKKTIQKYRPKLAICIYHKPEDIIILPLYIKSLVPQYKFYLRSYSNADHEMVLYAIP